MRTLIRLDDALHALAAQDDRKSRVVDLRFFGGLTAEETAAALHVSSKTVLRLGFRPGVAVAGIDLRGWT
jgi:DNA-directed RNA polymerase specialized sigma24 family protein